MNDFIFSINAVLPLFILTALGWFLTKIKVWDENFLKTGNSISFNILIPAMLFYNIYISDFGAVFNANLLAFTMCMVVAVCAISLIFVPLVIKERPSRGVIIQALFRGNFALLGVPLCQSLAGDEGGQVASVFIAFIIPAFNILATVILSVYSDNEREPAMIILKKVIKNPLIIACILGMIFNFLKIPLPQIILKPVKDLKSIATPFALLVLGGDFKFKSFIGNLKRVLCTGLCRLIVVPTVAVALAALLGFRGLHIALVISTFATPVAVSSTAMTYKMNGDYDLACQLVVFTTVLSAFTITLFAFISRTIGIL